MNTDRQLTWERNGNFPSERGGIHTMDDPRLPLSKKFSIWNADWNSNQILSPDTHNETGGGLTCGNCQCQNNAIANTNESFAKEKPVIVLNSPRTATCVQQKDLSYDDLSKNIDANLAEIDMETFRSEDINSILALPAIYSGNFESVNHGEQCASVSGSLLNGLEIETSVSNRISEDEISICKDEPLFSPQREPLTNERAISVDGLDNSSSYDQDLVLTCKANKNNYTIVFEGSETQFSEDSEYHTSARSSEADSSVSEALQVNQENLYTANAMIQSDLVFTTWSNLKRTTHPGRKKNTLPDISVKSQSLPNLCYQSALVNERKIFQWAKLNAKKNPHLRDFELFQPNNLQIARQCGYPYTLSLVKLFMKYKVSSRSSVCSSDHSNSTTSLFSHSLNNFHYSLPNVAKAEMKDVESKERSNDDSINQNYMVKNGVCENLNANKKQLFVDNVKILDWLPGHTRNVNNNNGEDGIFSENLTNSRLSSTKTVKSGYLATTLSTECDNSQCFEDSLIEAPVLQVKNFHTMPIKEEEETDISSGDEVMRTSTSSESNNTSAGTAVIQNNVIGNAVNVTRQEGEHNNIERITNVFPSCKSNAPSDGIAANIEVEKANTIKAESPLLRQNQEIQTKHNNSINSINIEGVNSSPVSNSKVSGKQICVERVTRLHSSSRDTSPNSSGYISSRHSSVERLQRLSLGNIESQPEVSRLSKLNNNGLFLTTRNCSTQIPVYVKDCCMQTSLPCVLPSHSAFTLKDCYKEDTAEIDCMEEPYSKPKHDNFSYVMHESLRKDKEDKCIYVCFPNYSLPDLSFLKSVVCEDSTVFLSPMKFKPPRDVIGTTTSSPLEGFDSTCRKRLSNIKDLDSLSVLLPDNLKHLVNEIKDSESMQESYAKGTNSQTKSTATSTMSSERREKAGLLARCDNFSKMHVPHDILRKSHLSRHGNKAPIQTYSSKAYNTCETMHLCNCQNLEDPSCELLRLNPKMCMDIPPVCDTFKMQSDHYPQNEVCSSAMKSKNSFVHMCSKETLHRHPPFEIAQKSKELGIDSCLEGPALGNNFGSERVCNHENEYPCTRMNCQQQHQILESAHEGRNILHCNKQRDILPALQSSGNCRYMYQPCKNDIKQRGNPSVHFATATVKSCEMSKPVQGCNRVMTEDLVGSDEAPHEFVISPELPDLYELHNPVNDGNNLFHSSLKKKTGLVENLQRAALAIFDDYEKNKPVSCCTSFSVGQKILTCLCPAVHTILSDGLRPSVQGFFGPLPNSPWKVAEASVLLENSKKEVQALLKQVNQEKLLTDSTYRFNAFIIGLLNLGSLEWWLGHLLSGQALIIQHYHPTALLSLLSLPASSHLQQELRELVSPLTNLSFSLDLAFETKMAAAKSREKCDGKCCRSEKQKVSDESIKKRQAHITFHLPTKKQDDKSCNRISIKTNGEQPKLKQSNKNQEHAVWPGVTINPFPNAQTPEGVSKKEFLHDSAGHNLSVSNEIKNSKSNCVRVANRTLSGKVRCNNKNLIPDVMCSSSDSGCSSQAGQHDISSAATESGELEIHSANKEDGHQFKKLQQKWEKITLGIDKPPYSKAVQQTTICCQNTATPKANVENTKKSTAKPQTRLLTKDESSRSHAKRATSSPPSGKQYTRETLEKYLTPLDRQKSQATEKVTSIKSPAQNTEKDKRRSKSQIPMLRATRVSQPKSKIDVQKSANR